MLTLRIWFSPSRNLDSKASSQNGGTVGMSRGYEPEHGGKCVSMRDKTSSSVDTPSVIPLMHLYSDITKASSSCMWRAQEVASHPRHVATSSRSFATLKFSNVLL